MPTRSGRHGLAFTSRGRVNLKNARHAEDYRPLDETVDCPASRDYSRAYLHHLICANEMLGQMLLTWHNTAYYQKLMADMRAAIEENRFGAFAEETEARWDGGDIARL
ncbi:MAG: tRNA-guanine transglycosylase, partial [Pseudomonadota bacterium]